MTEKSVPLLLLMVAGAILAMIFTISSHDGVGLAAPAQFAGELNALPPSAAGLAAASELNQPAKETAPADGYIGGTRATGRVSDIYLKLDQGVFIAIDQAPESLRRSAERWVDVQFPELLANSTGAARAFISKAQANIGPGDIVEIKFAHKSSRDSSQFFPVKEITRVTELVAGRDEMLAKDYERRILARGGQGRETQLIVRSGAQPAWLPQPVQSPIALQLGAIAAARAAPGTAE